jgi:hypothetical protein
MSLAAVASPSPTEVQSLLGDRCEKPWKRVAGLDLPEESIQEYGDSGCKLAIFSPDHTTLAYVTLTGRRDEDVEQEVYVDTVRLHDAEVGEDRAVYFVGRLATVDSLGWSPKGQLIIGETLWEGPSVVHVYDPAADAMVSAMRLDRDGSLTWNAERTAMYAAHAGEFGSDQCIHELGGFDFAHGGRFPDLYAIYGIEEAEDPLGIPVATGDALSVEPHGWSTDGESLWITVTRLTLNESTYVYELGPRQAAALELSDDGVRFKTLAADPRFDYAFAGAAEPGIVSQPYQPRHCP